MSRAGRRKLTKRYRIAVERLIKGQGYKYTLKSLESLLDPLQSLRELCESYEKGGYSCLYENVYLYIYTYTRTFILTNRYV